MQIKENTWLDLQVWDGTTLRVGCLACSYAQTSCPFGEHRAKLDITNFRRHQLTTTHLQAVSKFVQGSVGAVPRSLASLEIIGTPPLSAFMTLLSDIQGGRSCHGIAQSGAVGGHQKVCRLLWCADESVKELLGRRLASSRSIGLCRDEAHGRLSIHFVACDRAYRPFGSLLGIERRPETGAEYILTATNDVIKRFSTRCFDWGHADLMPKVAPEYLRKRAHYIRTHVRIVANDAASDELLATAMGRRPDIHSSTQTVALTPNVVVQIRDRSHCCKRMLQRPFTADAYLWQAMKWFCRSRTSILMLIHYSAVIRGWFSEAIQSMESGAKSLIQNLSAAKHRPESYRKPLGRGLKNLLALFAVAVKCVATRSPTDKAHIAGLGFLEGACDERFIQLGMMADFADEVFKVLRFVDNPKQA